jgi:hypothetical protein
VSIAAVEESKNTNSFPVKDERGIITQSLSLQLLEESLSLSTTGRLNISEIDLSSSSDPSLLIQGKYIWSSKADPKGGTRGKSPSSLRSRIITITSGRKSKEKRYKGKGTYTSEIRVVLE